MITKGTEIDATRAKYKTSIEALEQFGFVSVPKEQNPPLIWIDGIISIAEAEALLPYQRVNKIPCMDFLCFKSTMFSELNAIKSFFPTYFEFYPHTYCLPGELPELERDHIHICNQTAVAPTWVIKPRAGSCGKGIHFIQSTQEANNITTPSIAQLLVNPFLIDKKKFDFRFYVLISSLDPLAVFIYREGIARFCTQPYSPPSRSAGENPFSLLTNTAINKKCHDIKPEEFTRPASEVLRTVVSLKPQCSRVWDEICTATVLTIVGLYPSIIATLPLNGGAPLATKLLDPNAPKLIVPRRPLWDKSSHYNFIGAQKKRASTKKRKKKIITTNTHIPNFDNNESPKLPYDSIPVKERVLTEAQHYFHILGIDIILDTEGHPMVLELNDRPSLQVTAPFELGLKESMIKEAFEHLRLDALTNGNNSNSNWQQILPVSENSQLYMPIKAMMQHQSGLKYYGRTSAKSPGTQRMVNAGIAADPLEVRKRIKKKEEMKSNNNNNNNNNLHQITKVTIACELPHIE
ncbi:Tubulin-tyrosine ligase family protein [Histomonas meleagridis]|uniref:Tubulin-tyrosine ligase family protein n=1 Tax=Histomonas meleagridis TaxID=135588 RepID=UPI0035596F74|nr:Tubulin-tyrosine ligase family protein [Histomonas meleagridis]KAH0800940.1 Tubulin-tyrosine ligase family protein [Histomonas meleagridis]